MTIKQFAQLCGCNPQTLRYYDHVDLLKPIETDKWSGYRYYNEKQALTFEKKKNLQTAGFSIDEIKEILNNDEDIIAAFERKIQEYKDKVQSIKKIKQSYQKEIENMEKEIEKLHNVITELMDKLNAEEEFGLDKTEYEEIVFDVNDLYRNVFIDDNNSGNKIDILIDTEENEDIDYFADKNYQIVFEKHGWGHAKEFIDDIPALRDDVFYYVCCSLSDKNINKMAFIHVLIAFLMKKNALESISMTNTVQISDDGENHFWLIRKKGR